MNRFALHVHQVDLVSIVGVDVVTGKRFAPVVNHHPGLLLVDVFTAPGNIGQGAQGFQFLLSCLRIISSG